MFIFFIVVVDIFAITYFFFNSKFWKKKKHKKERQKLTKAMREKVLKRDHYTCKKCGASLKKEPHLLLEVEHIKPIAKNGKTEMSNLQTLCWKCNRKKGAKSRKY